jgi:2-haloalkanoic acid dehalogenase type II
VRDPRLARPPGFRVITFDCYGTLIDWETGIRAGFKQALENLGLSQSEETSIFELYQEEEKRIERLSYRPYRRVLAEALTAAADKIGKPIPVDASDLLAERLPTWLPFPDTNPALEILAQTNRLGILSNVDNDLLEGTLRQFTVPFDVIVTAEQVRSYKPKMKHFEEALKMIGTRRTWLHVAASLYHDIEPASQLQIRTVWVNRKDATLGRDYDRRMTREVRDLAELASLLTRDHEWAGPRPGAQER